MCRAGRDVAISAITRGSGVGKTSTPPFRGGCIGPVSGNIIFPEIAPSSQSGVMPPWSR